MKDANTMVDSQTKKVVGISFEKKDAMDKVLGKAMYAADLKFDNMLFVGVKRSEVPCGKIISINTEKAKKLPGVAAVLTHKDIPGQNGVGIITKEEPVLMIDKIRRQGDAIVVVAAENKKILEEALDLIEVVIEETKGSNTKLPKL